MILWWIDKVLLKKAKKELKDKERKEKKEKKDKKKDKLIKGKTIEI